MKRLERSTIALTLLIGALLAETAHAQEAASAGGTIRARVSGMRNDKGKLACLLFPKSDGWPGDVKRARAQVRSGIASGAGECVFTGVPAGRYAVAVMHDEDDNGKMKQNFVGAPEEGYGASNNPSNGFMSGPPYDKSSFEHDGKDRTLDIQMRS